MAVLVQYQSAKLGLVTGKSLPQLLGDRMAKRSRIAFWLQAEIVAAATDLAEVIGGAIALNLLFNVSLLTGAIITGFVSILLLLVQGEDRQHIFERVVLGLLLVITFGFMAGLVLDPPSASAVSYTHLTLPTILLV